MIRCMIILSLAVLLDLIFGDPIRIPHPIIYIGKLISFLEEKLRKSKLPLKVGGFLLLIGTVSIMAGVITLLLQCGYWIHPYVGDGITIYLLYTSLAAKCLKDEVMKVHDAMVGNYLDQGRLRLSYLVGRDTKNLTRDEVIRGAIETGAENTVDGVLAPLMFLGVGLLLGIPVQCVFIYKTVNTLDSMVGYKQSYYKDIGFASARMDDLLNYIPARFGSVCMLIGGCLLRLFSKSAIQVWWRDRRNHSSPNCGYPEAAVAGLLGIQIGGTNTYFDEVVYKPTIGDSCVALKPSHIKDTIYIMYGAEMVLFVMLAIVIGIFKGVCSWT